MIKKRNGQLVEFDFSKIESAVSRTFKASGYEEIPKEFLEELQYENFERFQSVEEIQDRVEKLLYYSGYRIVYNNFVTYRANHALMRESKNKIIFDSIINTEKNDITRDNGNMNADSPAGQMMKFASETTKPFVNKYMLDTDVKEAMNDNYLYIHDRDYFPTRSLTCVTGDANIRLKDDKGNIIHTKLNYFDKEFLANDELQEVRLSKFLQVWGRNGWTRVMGVSRHALTDSEQLYKIRFGKGVELKVTGDHLIPVTDENGDNEILMNVKDLLPGMHVLKPGYFNESMVGDEYIDLIQEINESDFPNKSTILISNIRDLIWYLKYKYQVMNLREWLGIEGRKNWPRGAKYITLDDYNKLMSEFDIPYEVTSTLTVKSHAGKDSLPLYLPVTNELAEIMGYLHSEGSISFSTKSGSYQIIFCNYDKDMRDRFEDAWYKTFPNKLTEFKRDGKVVGLTGSSKLLAGLFAKILEKKDHSQHIHIPNFIMNGTDEIKWHYISALIDGDGCVTVNSGKSISYCTISRELSEQLVELFSSLGVESVINEAETEGKLTKFGDIVSKSNANTQRVVVTGYEYIEKVLINLKCIKQNSIDAFYAARPKKAVINTPTKIIEILEIEGEHQYVYDLETVEHWWVVNNVVVHNCLQHPLDRILDKGFMAGHGEARPAKRIETAAILAAISMETIQNEMHGGQAIPAFDFYMAPYVRLTYIEEVNRVKEFVDNRLLKESWWEDIRNAQFKDYVERPLPSSTRLKERVTQMAMNNTVRRVHQAMESFIHNMNSIHSRGGWTKIFLY